MCLNHILCKVGLMWMHVFGLKSNDCYFLKMCCMHLDKYLCTIPIIVYVCCLYSNGCSF